MLPVLRRSALLWSRGCGRLAGVNRALQTTPMPSKPAIIWRCRVDDLTDDDVCNYWSAGDVVRCWFHNNSYFDIVLDERLVEEMNDGENPLYPWKVERFERLAKKEE